jgi:hypothetical protein
VCEGAWGGSFGGWWRGACGDRGACSAWGSRAHTHTHTHTHGADPGHASCRRCAPTRRGTGSPLQEVRPPPCMTRAAAVGRRLAPRTHVAILFWDEPERKKDLERAGRGRRSGVGGRESEEACGSNSLVLFQSPFLTYFLPTFIPVCFPFSSLPPFVSLPPISQPTSALSSTSEIILSSTLWLSPFPPSPPPLTTSAASYSALTNRRFTPAACEYPNPTRTRPISRCCIPSSPAPAPLPPPTASRAPLCKGPMASFLPCRAPIQPPQLPPALPICPLKPPTPPG